jgi:hypothetical protein
MSFWYDAKWRMRMLAAKGMSLDGVRMGDLGTGQVYEVVQPRWWQLRRWWKWLRAPGEVTATLHGPDGKPRLVRLRAVFVVPPKPHDIPVGDGDELLGARTVRATAVDPLKLARRGHDPHHRATPDRVLERNGVTTRDRLN